MRQMQSVLWTKGVLLTPQHLQMQDRFLESQFAFRLSALSPWPWGFSRLAVDREALAGGNFALKEAAGIFPDGLPFDMPAAEPLPSPRAFGEHWDPDVTRRLVHMAVPEERLGGQNVSDDGPTRYRAEVVMRRDENTGLAEKPVQVARKNVRFVMEGEPLEGHVAMPVARIERSPAGFALDPTFIPPLLDASASATVQGVVRRLVEVMVARAAALSELRRRRSQGVASFGVSDVANFWLLYALNESLPGVRHFLEPGQGHPASLYATLVSLAGSLTTFSRTVRPEELPGYAHDDLGSTFLPLEQAIQELLRSVVPDRHVGVPLIEGDRSIFTGRLEDEHLARGERFFIAFKADGKPAEIAAKVPELLKVGSLDRVEQLISYARPGLSLKHLATLPPAIPIKSDYEYFEVDRDHPEWPAVRDSRTFSVYVSGEFENPSLELVILLPEEDG